MRHNALQWSLVLLCMLVCAAGWLLAVPLYLLIITPLGLGLFAGLYIPIMLAQQQFEQALAAAPLAGPSLAVLIWYPASIVSVGLAFAEVESSLEGAFFTSAPWRRRWVLATGLAGGGLSLILPLVLPDHGAWNWTRDEGLVLLAPVAVISVGLLGLALLMGRPRAQQRSR